MSQIKMDDREAMAWQLFTKIYARRCDEYTTEHLVDDAFRAADKFVTEMNLQRAEGQR